MKELRESSLRAYEEIKRLGLLSRWKWNVYNVIAKFGPITQGEAWKEHFPEKQRHSVAPRFAELEGLGVIQPIGERPCRVTGKKNMVWIITNGLPKKEEKKELICPICKGKGKISHEIF